VESKANERSRSVEQSEPVSGTVRRGQAPLLDKRAAMTMTAREGLDAAELVNAALGRRTFGEQVPRRLEVIAPDGPSTAGGKRARQTVRLVPLAGDTAPLMCGVLDVAQRTVELRNYEAVRAQYEERFKEPLDISPDDYARLRRELEATLTPFRYRFTVEAPDTTDTRAQLTREGSVTPPPRAPLLNVILLGLVAVIVAAIALAMTLR
jgi:hypothetical protein